MTIIHFETRRVIDMSIDEAIKELKNSNYLTNSEELQLAEWLEELKVYQQHEIISRKGYNTGYNKAIDDFVKKVELEYLGVHPDELYEKYYPSEICKQIKRLAEQLKAGDNNGT